jgi:hypothetical protein
MEKLLVVVDLNERDNNNKLHIQTLFCDNLGANTLMQDTKFHNKAKHIEIRNTFIRTDMTDYASHTSQALIN